MLATNMKLDPAVLNTLQIWHDMIETRDLGRLESIVHPEAAFRSCFGVAPSAYRRDR